MWLQTPHEAAVLTLCGHEGGGRREEGGGKREETEPMMEREVLVEGGVRSDGEHVPGC